MQRPSQRILDGVGTLVRLGLAAVWLISGGIKISEPGQTYIAMQAYELFPAGSVSTVATVAPLIELALGAFLLLGLGTRVLGGLSVLMLLALIGVVAQAWARGLTIDCGCFGGGGPVESGDTKYPQEILRDVAFMVLAVWLLIRPRTVVSMDGWLGWTARSSSAKQDGELTDYEAHEGN